MKILIIDDNQKFTKVLKDNLDSEYEMYILNDYEQANEILQKKNFDIILLDVHLGRIDAREIITHIKRLNRGHIIAITSDEKRETALQMYQFGVVDYIVKPIDYDILKLKLANLEMSNTNILKYKDLELNLQNFVLNDDVTLSKNEMIVLQYFLKHPGELITKKQLLKVLWNNDQFVEEAALNMLLSRIRKKIQMCDTKVTIDTMRAKGLVLR